MGIISVYDKITTENLKNGNNGNFFLHADMI